MRTSVCYRCAKREIGCHANCQAYIDQAAEWQRENNEIRQNRTEVRVQMERAIEGRDRMKKRHHH